MSDNILPDITDRELIERMVKYVKNTEGGNKQRWACVRDISSMGSGYSIRLCREFNLDPDELIEYSSSSEGEADYIGCIEELQARITELETITDEKVERVARALYELEPNINSLGRKTTWANLEEYHWKSFYKKKAKAALKAAIGGGDECMD